MSSGEKPLLSVTGMVGAAIFGALGAVVAFMTAPYLPRLAWGIAWIDPVSIIWVTCFLIFGAAAGILCCFIGTVALMFVDPFTPVGPVMKLLATLPMILIPFIILKLKKSWNYSSIELKGEKNYPSYTRIYSCSSSNHVSGKCLGLYLYVWGCRKRGISLGT